MFQKKKGFSFSTAFILMAMVINIIIIKIAFINNPDFYWALLFSIPFMAFAIYYQRMVAKKEIKRKKNGDNDNLFGTDHVLFSSKKSGDELTVLFGNSHCSQPYRSSIICVESVSAGQNISFMPKQIIFSEDNSTAHDMVQRQNDDLFINDSIWSIGPGYAGCRDHNFKFNAESFRENAARPNVKMIELKLPGLYGKDNISTSKNFYSTPAYNSKYTRANFKHICAHTAFSNAESMAIFLDSLRQLSGKKPIGIRLCITDKKEFYEIGYAFRKTGIIPDYIVIEDNAKESNSLSNSSQNPGMPLYEALLFVSKTLEIYGLSKEIKIMAASEVYTALDVLKLIALGADAIIMQNSLLPHNNQKMIHTPPTIFSKDYWQLRNEILKAAVDLMMSFGFIKIKEITLPSLLQRLNNPELMNTGMNRQHFKDDGHEKSFRIIKNAYTEKNEREVISFN